MLALQQKQAHESDYDRLNPATKPSRRITPTARRALDAGSGGRPAAWYSQSVIQARYWDGPSGPVSSTMPRNSCPIWVPSLEAGRSW